MPTYFSFYITHSDPVDKYYVEHTNDLKRRLLEHNNNPGMTFTHKFVGY